MAGTDQKISVIVTGQVRDEEIFVRSLAAFKSMAAVERVVLATWRTEADAHAQFLNRMTYEYGLGVVTATEPPQWSGNLLSQMVALYMGLGAVDPAHRVLKTRTDVFIEPAAIESMTSRDLAIRPPANFPGMAGILEEKICVWGIEATSPFYIHDLFFLARHADMAKLVNMDVRYDLLYHMSREKIHIRRFLHPFLHAFPAFEKFLHASHILGLTPEFPGPYRQFVLERMLENQVYVKILALYYLIMASCFTCDWGPGDIFEWRDIPPLKNFTPGDRLEDFLSVGEGEKTIMPAGDIFFQTITERAAASSPLGDRFSRALDDLEGLDDLGNACLEEDFAAFLEEALDVGSQASEKLRDASGG